jgi:hypothetical protein
VFERAHATDWIRITSLETAEAPETPPRLFPPLIGLDETGT